MKQITRREAKEQGLKRYFTGKPCKHGHISERYTRCGGCIKCGEIYRLCHAEDHKAYLQEHYQKNRQEYIDKADEWARGNHDKVRKTKAAWKKRNRAVENEHTRNWRQKNPGKVQAHVAKRRAKKLQAMPPWADQKFIAEFYEAARVISEKTGVPHHVDHIVPLNHPDVCGLHIPANLDVIPEAENLQKSNSIPEGRETARAEYLTA